jgi:hypothetical protein
MAYVHMWRIEYQTKNDFPLDMEVEEIDAQISDIFKYYFRFTNSTILSGSKI